MALPEPIKPHPFVSPTPSMLVVQGMPPMADVILAAFPHARGQKILYCWGTTIYASNGAICGPEKVAHETIHAIRQGDDVEEWWRRYIVDPAFRFAEEVPAHVAEYIFQCEAESGRAARRRNLARIASALASPLYGGLCTVEKAKRLILDGASATRG